MVVVSSANLTPTLAPTLPSTHPSPIPRPTLSEVVKGMEVVKAIEAVGAELGRSRRTPRLSPGSAASAHLAPGRIFSGPWGRRLWHWLSGTHFPTHSRTHPPTPEHTRQLNTSKKVVVADCGEIAPSDPSFLDKD